MPLVLFAQEGRYGQFLFQRPPSDLERQGIHGNVSMVVSYEGMASRNARGVVFSDEPLKIITNYNRLGNMTRQESYRYGKLIESTEFTYDNSGILIGKTTTQANGVVTSRVRYMNDVKNMLCNQMNCYNYSGNLTQVAKYKYNAAKNVVSQSEFGPNGVRRSVVYNTYDSENRLLAENDYECHRFGADSILYYKAEYIYNSHNNVLMRTTNMLKNNGSGYDTKIRHYRYYQYDREDNWRICCIYLNALEVDNRLVPQNMIVREITYY